MPRHLIVCLALLPGICLPGLSVQADPSGNIGFERGVNLSHWYAQIFTRMDRLEHLRTHVTREDIALIRSLGLDHVRLPVNPEVLQAQGYDGWAEYRRAVDMILDHGLNVIVDVHPDGDFKTALENEASARDGFVSFWRDLSGLLADTDAARLRFELLNEPVMPIGLWGPLQQRLSATVRASAPEHTIVLGGAKWSGVSQLLELEPLDDPNVVYNFHFYEPHQFTHQAATWGAAHWREMKGLPYPASVAGVQAALAATEDPRAIADITGYGQSGWNGEKVHEEIARAAQWAQAHGGLTLSCNEFGVYSKAADPAHRAAWLRDVRSALESHGIGWAMWDYAGGFGVTRDGEPIPEVVRALVPRGGRR